MQRNSFAVYILQLIFICLGVKRCSYTVLKIERFEKMILHPTSRLFKSADYPSIFELYAWGAFLWENGSRFKETLVSGIGIIGRKCRSATKYLFFFIFRLRTGKNWFFWLRTQKNRLFRFKTWKKVNYSTLEIEKLP